MWAISITGIILILMSLALLKLLVLKRRLSFGILFLFCLFFGITLAYVGYNIGPYQIFNEQEPVAEIECRKVEGEIYDMVLLINFLRSLTVVHKEKFLLTGNQWAIEGHIFNVNLPKNLKSIHLYKLMRIRSRFLNPRYIQQSPRLVYNIGGKKDRLWQFFNKHKFALVDAVLASTGYNFTDKKNKFYLYITSRGFVIKKIK